MFFQPQETDMQDRHIIFYHSPQSRSEGTHTLLEELGADYEMRRLNLKEGEQRRPEYLAVNPMGKVPAIVHAGALVTEQPAIFLYLADLYPEAGLAPAISDPLRGPYLRWMVFYAASFEPALMDRARKVDPGPASSSPYGDFDTMLGTLTAQLEQGPYLLGERFTALDVLWGTALAWTTMFGMVPATPRIQAYIERVTSRPAAQRAKQVNAQLAAG
jgi:glutathione S-transferase